MPNETESSLTESQDDTSFVSLQDESCPNMPHCPTLTISTLRRALDELKSDPSNPQATIQITGGFELVLDWASEEHRRTDSDFAEASKKYGMGEQSKGFNVDNLILILGSNTDDVKMPRLDENTKEAILADCSDREIPSSIQMKSLSSDRGTFIVKIKEWELAQLPGQFPDGSATFSPLVFRHVISEPVTWETHASTLIEGGKSSEGSMGREIEDMK